MNEQQRMRLFAEFTTLGEAKVRHFVETGTWAPHDPSKNIAAKEWLIQEATRREDEGIVVARRAYRMAVWANIVAIISLALSFKDHILALIFGRS